MGVVTYLILTKKELVTPQWSGHVGRIDETFLKKTVPDFAERLYYLSGPSSMVDAYKTLLKLQSIPSRNIITDYFPGL